MKRLLLNSAVLFTISVAAVACAPTEATRGNYLFDDDINTIKPYTSTQYDVMNTLGTPTAKAVFDDNTWYYVGLKTKKKSFFDEKVSERQMYKVTFDETGTVTQLAEIDPDVVDVPIESRVTPTSGNEVTFLQQILGNIGKFNAPVDQGNPAR